MTEYRLQKSNAVFAYIMIAESVFLLIFFGYLLHDFKISSILLPIVATLCIVLAKELYDSSKLVLIVEAEGLRITGDKNKGHIFVPWDELKYACRCLTIHGHSFWVISSETIDEKKAKRIVNTKSMFRILIDNMIVLPEKMVDKENVIETQIISRIPNVVDKYK